MRECFRGKIKRENEIKYPEKKTGGTLFSGPGVVESDKSLADEVGPVISVSLSEGLIQSIFAIYLGRLMGSLGDLEGPEGVKKKPGEARSNNEEPRAATNT